MQVMVSPTGEFMGDMQHLLLIPATFSEFLDGSLLDKAWHLTAGQALEASSSGFGDGSRSKKPHLYLAQVPVMHMISAEVEAQAPLSLGTLFGLMKDIRVPPMLHAARELKIHFWGSLR
jgi:hypothetical protein